MSRSESRSARPGWKAMVVAAGGVLALLATVALSAPTATAATDATLLGSAVPAVTAEADSGAVELGVTVIPRVNGTISGVRYYRASGNGGTHTGSLWTADGRKLATASFRGETASGWQQVAFPNPVAVSAGRRYVVSYYAPHGHYAAAQRFFGTSYVRGDLTVPVDGGVYRYGASGFPTSTYRATNYYVDLLFRPSSAIDTTAPVISGLAVSGVSASDATVSWTTDEPASTQVDYGLGTSYGSTSSDPTSTTTHRRTLGGLTAGTTYHFQAQSADASGNRRVTADATFTTGPAGSFNPGNTSGTVAISTGMGTDDVSRPDRVVGTGTPASCTSAAVVAAVQAGGVITFDCGPAPTTITLAETLKVRNSTAKLVLDGGGRVTLSGAGVRRILYVDTCDRSLGAVSGNCLYAPTQPQVTVQNLTLADGNATGAPYVSPGDTNQGSNGGGAIFALGGRLKVVRSVFVRNSCAANGPDLGGGAVRVLAQNSPTPNDLDASHAARNQHPVAIVQSTFGGVDGQGNRCSNGGAISGLRTPITVINANISYNHAIGCCANPAKPGTPGGGSGGAIYTDGTSYDLKIAGSLLQRNTAKAGGSAIFDVSNDRTGHLYIDRSTSKDNTYVASGQPNPQSFENHPGIFYLGSGAPVFTNSTIR